MRNDLITIVIPTYNEKEMLLRQAIETVLNQTYDAIELIVVDDGCTDNTPEVLKSYGDSIRVFRRERTSSFRSVAEAFNVGLENAKGKWWHHDAADCYHDLTWAEQCMDFISGREDQVFGIHTDFAVHNFDGSVKHIRTEKVWNPHQSTYDNYRQFDHFGGMIFRMDLCKKAGPWDVRFPRHQTREWTYRVLCQFEKMEYLPVELWHFIYHEQDQLKRNASVKYRILADLKNGIDPVHDFAIAFRSEAGRVAVIEAFRAFFSDPEWEKERTDPNLFGKVFAMKKICDEEASEVWVKK